jgi:hypothetical protein
MDIVTKKQQKVHCEVLTDCGQNVVGNVWQIDTELTDGEISVIDSFLKDCKMLQWTEGH